MSEFDTPANLLRNPASAFSKMVADTGAANATLLTEMALAAEQAGNSRGAGPKQLSAEQLAAGARLAPDAAAAGFSSPSLMAQPSQPPHPAGRDEGGLSSFQLDGDVVEMSHLRWHEDADAEESWLEDTGLLAEAEPMRNAIRSTVKH